jgi:hypothetical protein
MTPHDEHLLYLRDRWAWAKYIAPKWVKMLEPADESERLRLWRIAGPELKAEIRALRQQSQT